MFESVLSVGLDHVPAKYGILSRIAGQDYRNVDYIQRSTGSVLEVIGQGSGQVDEVTGKPSDKPLQIIIRHVSKTELDVTHTLVESLIKKVQEEFKDFKPEPISHDKVIDETKKVYCQTCDVYILAELHSVHCTGVMHTQRLKERERSHNNVAMVTKSDSQSHARPSQPSQSEQKSSSSKILYSSSQEQKIKKSSSHRHSDSSPRQSSKSSRRSRSRSRNRSQSPKKRSSSRKSRSRSHSPKKYLSRRSRSRSQSPKKHSKQSRSRSRSPNDSSRKESHAKIKRRNSSPAPSAKRQSRSPVRSSAKNDQSSSRKHSHSQSEKRRSPSPARVSRKRSQSPLGSSKTQSESSSEKFSHSRAQKRRSQSPISEASRQSNTLSVPLAKRSQFSQKPEIMRMSLTKPWPVGQTQAKTKLAIPKPSVEMMAKLQGVYEEQIDDVSLEWLHDAAMKHGDLRDTLGRGVQTDDHCIVCQEGMVTPSHYASSKHCMAYLKLQLNLGLSIFSRIFGDVPFSGMRTNGGKRLAVAAIRCADAEKLPDKYEEKQAYLESVLLIGAMTQHHCSLCDSSSADPAFFFDHVSSKRHVKECLNRLMSEKEASPEQIAWPCPKLVKRFGEWRSQEEEQFAKYIKEHGVMKRPERLPRHIREKSNESSEQARSSHPKSGPHSENRTTNSSNPVISKPEKWRSIDKGESLKPRKNQAKGSKLVKPGEENLKSSGLSTGQKGKALSAASTASDEQSRRNSLTGYQYQDGSSPEASETEDEPRTIKRGSVKPAMPRAKVNDPDASTAVAQNESIVNKISTDSQRSGSSQPGLLSKSPQSTSCSKSQPTEPYSSSPRSKLNSTAPSSQWKSQPPLQKRPAESPPRKPPHKSPRMESHHPSLQRQSHSKARSRSPPTKSHTSSSPTKLHSKSPQTDPNSESPRNAPQSRSPKGERKSQSFQLEPGSKSQQPGPSDKPPKLETGSKSPQSKLDLVSSEYKPGSKSSQAEIDSKSHPPTAHSRSPKSLQQKQDSKSSHDKSVSKSSQSDKRSQSPDDKCLSQSSQPKDHSHSDRKSHSRSDKSDSQTRDRRSDSQARDRKSDSQTQDKRSDSQTRDRRADSQAKDCRPDSQTRDHKSDSQIRYSRSDSQARDHKSDSQTGDQRADSKAKDRRSDSQTRDRKSDAQARDRRSDSQTRDRKSDSQTQDRKSDSQTRDRRSDLQAKDQKSDSQTRDRKSDSQTQDRKSDSQTQDRSSDSQAKDRRSDSQKRDRKSDSQAQDRKSDSKSSRQRSRSKSPRSRSHSHQESSSKPSGKSNYDSHQNSGSKSHHRSSSKSDHRSRRSRSPYRRSRSRSPYNSRSSTNRSHSRPTQRRSRSRSPRAQPSHQSHYKHSTSPARRYSRSPGRDRRRWRRDSRSPHRSDRSDRYAQDSQHAPPAASNYPTPVDQWGNPIYPNPSWPYMTPYSWGPMPYQNYPGPVPYWSNPMYNYPAAYQPPAGSDQPNYVNQEQPAKQPEDRHPSRRYSTLIDCTKKKTEASQPPQPVITPCTHQREPTDFQPKPFPCTAPVCTPINVGFDTKSALDEHLSKTHYKRTCLQFRCPVHICPATAETQADMEKHMYCDHGEKFCWKHRRVDTFFRECPYICDRIENPNFVENSEVARSSDGSRDAPPPPAGAIKSSPLNTGNVQMHFNQWLRRNSCDCVLLKKTEEDKESTYIKTGAERTEVMSFTVHKVDNDGTNFSNVHTAEEAVTHSTQVKTAGEDIVDSSQIKGVDDVSDFSDIDTSDIKTDDKDVTDLELFCEVSSSCENASVT